MRIEVAGQVWALARVGDTWRLERPGAAPVDLSDAEAAILLRRRGETGRSLVREGLPAADGRLRAELDEIHGRYDEDALAVMLDSTTLRNVSAALASTTVGPLQLMDLALVVHAVVLHDVVLVGTSLSDVFGGLSGAPDLFVPARLSSRETTETLWSLCVEQLQIGVALQSEFAEDWQELLRRRDPVPIDLRTVIHDQPSPGMWDGTVASDYMDLAYAGVSLEGRALTEFLSVQTMRTLYNDRVAGMLGVPLWSSAFRSPISARLLRQKAEKRPVADEVLGRLMPRQAPSGPYMQRLKLPPLLSLLLRGMVDLNEFWPAVQDLRADFQPVRDAIRRARGSGESDLLRRYGRWIESVGAGAARTTATQDAAEAALAVLVAPTSAPVQALTLMGKLASARGVSAVRDGLIRALRPDLHVIGNVAHEARRLLEIEHELARLWGRQWTREDFDDLERLSKAQVQRFLAVA